MVRGLGLEGLGLGLGLVGLELGGQGQNQDQGYELWLGLDRVSNQSYLQGLGLRLRVSVRVELGFRVRIKVQLGVQCLGQGQVFLGLGLEIHTKGQGLGLRISQGVRVLFRVRVGLGCFQGQGQIRVWVCEWKLFQVFGGDFSGPVRPEMLKLHTHLTSRLRRTFSCVGHSCAPRGAQFCPVLCLGWWESKLCAQEGHRKRYLLGSFLGGIFGRSSNYYAECTYSHPSNYNLRLHKVLLNYA